MLYLKSGYGIAAESLVRENTALEWLEHKHITVPKVLNYFKDEGNGQVYLLLSVIDGLPAQRVTDLSKQEILQLVAEAMKQFHSINFQGSENLRTLEQDLTHIQSIINLNLIKRSKFWATNNDKTPEEVYAYLRKLQYKFSKDVIVHGDYCLPNIIIAKESYGFIDVGDCGPGDPYKDFSAMEVSITRNFGKEWIDVFYKYYDQKINVDPQKIKYFQLIDQFGYHLDVEKYYQAIRVSNVWTAPRQLLSLSQTSSK
jgi:aminoglycoside phosphotransferase